MAESQAIRIECAIPRGCRYERTGDAQRADLIFTLNRRMYVDAVALSGSWHSDFAIIEAPRAGSQAPVPGQDVGAVVDCREPGRPSCSLASCASAPATTSTPPVSKQKISVSGLRQASNCWWRIARRMLRWAAHDRLEPACGVCLKFLQHSVHKRRAAVQVMGLAALPLEALDLEDLVAVGLLLEPPAPAAAEAFEPEVAQAIRFVLADSAARLGASSAPCSDRW